MGEDANKKRHQKVPLGDAKKSIFLMVAREETAQLVDRHI